LAKEYLIEINLAEEFIEVAKNNLGSSLRTSANRAYFALEKAVVSFLMFKRLNKLPKNHQKIWELASEFLGEGAYQLLRELYDLRMQADYGSVSLIVDFNEKVVGEKILEVKNFIEVIKKKINKRE
jgi:uncharacterized protein (UPF0332 family)